MEKILKILEENARISLEDIATMVESTPEEVAKQIDAYQQAHVINGYKALIDWDKAGADRVQAIIELRVSPKRENTYVAGLSMGGYGAMKIALTYPEKFGFAASFSGALDIVALMQDDKEQIAHEGQNLRGKKSDTEVVLETKEFIFGPHGTMKGSKNDLHFLLEQAAKQKKPLPRLYISCGSADTLFPSAVDMRNRAKALGYQVKFHEERNMGHSWAFWDKEVEKLIRDIIVED